MQKALFFDGKKWLNSYELLQCCQIFDYANIAAIWMNDNSRTTNLKKQTGSWGIPITFHAIWLEFSGWYIDFALVWSKMTFFGDNYQEHNSKFSIPRSRPWHTWCAQLSPNGWSRFNSRNRTSDFTYKIYGAFELLYN